MDIDTCAAVAAARNASKVIMGPPARIGDASACAQTLDLLRRPGQDSSHWGQYPGRSGEDLIVDLGRMEANSRGGLSNDAAETRIPSIGIGCYHGHRLQLPAVDARPVPSDESDHRRERVSLRGDL